MFYVAELNLKGKGPLSRLWQACHSSKNVNRKIAAEFKYEDGYEAIVNPTPKDGFALRLSAKLLLGLSRLHRAKVDYFQEDIKQTHDRITLSFKLVSSSAVDQPSAKKGKARVESITLTADNDLDIHFDVLDELPEWLASDVLEIPSVIANSLENSSMVYSQNRRPGSNRSITLPDRMSESGFLSTSDNVFSDLLEVPGGDMLQELELDFFSESYDNTSRKQQSIEGSIIGAIAEEAHDPLSPSKPEAEWEAANFAEHAADDQQSTKKRKRKNKTRLQENTEIPKDECRKWASQLPEYLSTLVRKPSEPPYKHILSDTIERIVSLPLSRTGKHLTNFLLRFGLDSNPDILQPKEQVKKRSRNAKGDLAQQEPTDSNLKDDAQIHDLDEYDRQYFDVGDSIGFDSESAGGRSSLLLEGPEHIRAGSEDGLDVPDLAFKRRRSSDILPLAGRFDFDPSQSPRGSSVKSHRSRLTSIGEFDLSFQIPGLTEADDENMFKDSMVESTLQEEPESHLASQITSVQRLSNNDLLVARHVANGLNQSDGKGLSFFQLLGLDADARKAARVFYSMLALQNDNVIRLEQQIPYEDIDIKSTPNTSMYEYSAA